jgi:hypothetical protein
MVGPKNASARPLHVCVCRVRYFVLKSPCCIGWTIANPENTIKNEGPQYSPRG